MWKNVIIFGDDISSSVYIGNKTKDILIHGEGAAQGLDDITLTAKAKYPINLTQLGRRFVYIKIEATISYLLMLQKFINCVYTVFK